LDEGSLTFCADGEMVGVIDCILDYLLQM
jgi:hypothetical protein